MKYQLKEGKEWEVDVCMWMDEEPPWNGGTSGPDMVIKDGKMINEFAKKTWWKDGINEKDIDHKDDGRSFIYVPSNVCFVTSTKHLEVVK